MEKEQLDDSILRSRGVQSYFSLHLILLNLVLNNRTMASSSASASPSTSGVGFAYSVKKSAAKAEEFKVIGNRHHGKKEMYEALMAFNESICYALPGSEGLAIAYGNRSAVYYHAEMYQKVLVSWSIPARLCSNSKDRL